MNIVDTYSLFCLIYLIPGYIFYVAFLYHLISKKTAETKTPFFSIIKIIAFVDLIEIIISSINTRMGSILSQIPFFLPLGSNNAILALLVYAMIVACSAQAWLHVILALNRLTAILYPTKYSKLWKGKYFFGMISIAFIIPAILFSWVLYYGATIIFVISFYAIDGIRTGIPWFRKSTFVIGNLGLTSILTLIFDSLTFILLKKGNLIKSNKSKYKQEFRFLTVSFAFLIVHIFYLANAVLAYFITFTQPEILVIFTQTILDIQSLISPFCVLLLNKNIRRSFFGQQKIVAVSANTVPSFHSNQAHLK